MPLDKIKILSGIRGTEEQRRGVVRDLAMAASLKSDVQRMVVSNNGGEDDALMIFHDSIIAFVKKVFSDRAMDCESVEGYIYGVARYMWLGKLRKTGRKLSIEVPTEEYVEGEVVSSDVALFKNERAGLLQKVLGVVGKNCREVLMYWAGGYSMKEIAELLGYKSEGMARKKKHNCYKALIQWLEQNPHYKKELAQG